MSKGPEVHRSIPLRPEMGADFIDTDVVVIGAGTAGCVIAARLSEVPHLRVVVVEAGPMDRNPWIHVPVGFSRLLHDDRVNWCYETVRQEALGGRQIFWPRGKVVGGSNAINGMIWVRGRRRTMMNGPRKPVTFVGLGNACRVASSPARGLPKMRMSDSVVTEASLCVFRAR